MDLLNMRVLVTGSKGFIGKNLKVHLNECPGVIVTTFDRGDDLARLKELLCGADCVVHLAGENRPDEPAAFDEVNAGLTSAVCDEIQNIIESAGRQIPILLASSTQATQDNPYGRSKLAAEEVLQRLAESTENPCLVFRLPGVFGKWCRPHYNSVVATFCHQLARDLPIQVNNPAAQIKLVYVDDVIRSMLAALVSPAPGFTRVDSQPEYEVTLRYLCKLPT